MYWHDICVIYLVTNEYNLETVEQGIWIRSFSIFQKQNACNISETSLTDLFYKLVPFLIGYSLLGVFLGGHVQSKYSQP
jgi:hypothetical protein